MKYFFGINVTENKENEILDGDRFISERADAELEEKIEQASSLAERADSLCTVSPSARRIGQTCAVFAVVWAVLLVFGLVRDASSVKTLPMIVTAVMVVISAAVAVIMLSRAKKQLQSTPERDEACERANAAFAEVTSLSAQKFGVPADCTDTDVLNCVYTVNNGVAEPYTMFRTALFMNYPRKVFVKDGYLCVSDIRSLYRVPVAALGEFKTVSRKCGLGFWNKSKPYTSAEYAPYGIKRGGNGILTLGSYIQVDAVLDGETYALLFPPYEEEKLKTMLGR